MESAIVLATFSLISLVIIYVVISSSSLNTTQHSRIVEREIENDVERVFTESESIYKAGWVSEPTSLGLRYQYDINVSPNSITMSYGNFIFSETGPVPFVPVNLSNISVVNISYVVFEGSGHINLSYG